MLYASGAGIVSCSPASLAKMVAAIVQTCEWFDLTVSQKTETMSFARVTTAIAINFVLFRVVCLIIISWRQRRMVCMCDCFACRVDATPYMAGFVFALGPCTLQY